MDKLKCKYCQSTNFYLKDNGPHVGLYCQVCGKYQKWIPQCEVLKYQQEGINYEFTMGGKNNHYIRSDNNEIF